MPINNRVLLIHKLSPQDHLEIFFSAIKAKERFNNNPAAAQFESSHKRFSVHAELTESSGGQLYIKHWI